MYNLACSWRITSYPCGSDSNSDYRPPRSGNTDLKTVGQELTLKKDGRPNQCATDFQCQSPGTYVLQLTVSDGCTTDTKSKTITCKCETQPIVDLGAASYETMFRCYGADTTPKFADTALDGSKSRIVLTTTGLDLGACPTAAAVPAPRPAAAPPAGSCCPAAPACPSCPACPQCPQCPGAAAPETAGSAETYTYYQQYAQASALARQQAFYAAQSDQLKGAKVPLSAVLGVAIPISTITVLSVIGNIFMQWQISKHTSKKV